MASYVTFYKLSNYNDLTINDFIEDSPKIGFNNINFACFANMTPELFKNNKYMYMIIPIQNNLLSKNQGIKLNKTQLSWIKDKGFVKFKIIKYLTEKESQDFSNYAAKKTYKHNSDNHVFIQIDLRQFINYKDFFLKIHLFRFMYEGYAATNYIKAVEEYMSIKDKKGIIFKDVLLYNILFFSYPDTGGNGVHSSCLKLSSDSFLFPRNLFKTKEYIQLISKEPYSSSINGQFTTFILKFKKCPSSSFIDFNEKRKNGK